MAERIRRDEGCGDLPGAFRSWMMVALTLLFVLLYGAALTGWLRPLADERMMTRLEPVIFVIIGYYFGRLPAQATEHTLRGEIARQTQKADAAQHAKEHARCTAEALEEKVRNARAALTAAGVRADSSPAAPHGGEALRHSVGAALSVLNS